MFQIKHYQTSPSIFVDIKSQIPVQASSKHLDHPDECKLPHFVLSEPQKNLPKSFSGIEEYKHLFLCLKTQKGVDSKAFLDQLQLKFKGYNHVANGGKGNALEKLLETPVKLKTKTLPLYKFLFLLNPNGRIFLTGSGATDVQKNKLNLNLLHDIDICLYFPAEELTAGDIEDFKRIFVKRILEIELGDSLLDHETIFELYTHHSKSNENGISLRLINSKIDISLRKDNDAKKISPYDSLWGAVRVELSSERYRITHPLPISVLQFIRQHNIDYFLTDINGLMRVLKRYTHLAERGQALSIIQPYWFSQFF